ncbi:hypothetical protein NI389_03580 [Pseudoalteromonas xiamenensis]|nr:hypothetical protein [Pseudoalteromonas xiamenensis]WMN60499.1 hypothetical protein NI389_03580 [Pseudoalteromonas xiamenensis]
MLSHGYDADNYIHHKGEYSELLTEKEIATKGLESHSRIYVSVLGDVT